MRAAARPPVCTQCQYQPQKWSRGGRRTLRDERAREGGRGAALDEGKGGRVGGAQRRKLTVASVRRVRVQPVDGTARRSARAQKRLDRGGGSPGDRRPDDPGEVRDRCLGVRRHGSRESEGHEGQKDRVRGLHSSSFFVWWWWCEGAATCAFMLLAFFQSCSNESSAKDRHAKAKVAVTDDNPDGNFRGNPCTTLRSFFIFSFFGEPRAEVTAPPPVFFGFVALGWRAA